MGTRRIVTYCQPNSPADRLFREAKVVFASNEPKFHIVRKKRVTKIPLRDFSLQGDGSLIAKWEHDDQERGQGIENYWLRAWLSDDKICGIIVKLPTDSNDDYHAGVWVADGMGNECDDEDQ